MKQLLFWLGLLCALLRAYRAKKALNGSAQWEPLCIAIER
jgi:hypothetical protein